MPMQEQPSQAGTKMEKEPLKSLDFESARRVGSADYFLLEYAESRDDRILQSFAKAELRGIDAWKQSEIKPDRSYIVDEEKLGETQDALEEFLRNNGETGKQIIEKESHRFFKSVDERRHSQKAAVGRVYVAGLISEGFGEQGEKYEIDSRKESELKAGQEKLKGYFEAAIEDGNLYLALNTFYDLYGVRTITRSTQPSTVEYIKFDDMDWVNPGRLSTYFNSIDLHRISRELDKISERAKSTADSGKMTKLYSAQLNRVGQIQEVIQKAQENRRRVELN